MSQRMAAQEGMPIATCNNDTPTVRAFGPDVSDGRRQEYGWFQASLSYVPEPAAVLDAVVARV
jgi:hypothetical protein